MSQEFQPMASQISRKAALPLAKIFATCRNNVSNTGPRAWVINRIPCRNHGIWLLIHVFISDERGPRCFNVLAHWHSYWKLVIILRYIRTRGCCNLDYAAETYMTLWSGKTSFAHNLFFSSPIYCKLCTEHGNDTAVLSAKFEIDWTTERTATDKREFTTCEFTIRVSNGYPILHQPQTIAATI